MAPADHIGSACNGSAGVTGVRRARRAEMGVRACVHADRFNYDQ